MPLSHDHLTRPSDDAIMLLKRDHDEDDRHTKNSPDDARVNLAVTEQLVMNTFSSDEMLVS